MVVTSVLRAMLKASPKNFNILGRFFLSIPINGYKKLVTFRYIFINNRQENIVWTFFLGSAVGTCLHVYTIKI